jgi:SAM-dependent methyltransferase
MRIPEKRLSSDASYLESHKHIKLEDKEAEFRNILRVIRMFRPLEAGTRMFEVGTGIGWFPLLCARHGMPCGGIDISPARVEYARQLGRQYGIAADVDVGNIEDIDLGASQYDVILALSVFEHVDRWQEGVARVHAALKPGGLLFFFSTNKFSIRSDEFGLPLYGLLPDRWRYRLRVYWEGEDIMKLGIDFHQFNYFQLRRFFRRVGFSRVLDLFDIAGAGELQHPTLWKRALLRAMRVRPFRALALTFAPGTSFVCIK